MSWFSGIFIYLITWMVVHFMVLPLGFHLPKYIKSGWASSAPEKPKLMVKVCCTTIISLVIWVGLQMFFKTHPDWLHHWVGYQP